MALRNASSKFSMPSFGRKSNANASQPNGINTSAGYDPNAAGASSPRVTSGTYGASVHSGDDAAGGNSGGRGLDGIGRKIGKSIAHTRLIPALGNQDLRLLQDFISSEKSVLTSTERLAVDMQTSASRLPTYGQQEGPDLQDVLSHSSTLLSQLSVALRTFAQHEVSMRACLKRIREREEALDEQRRRRRTVGQRADAAEAKLAKMGPENKQLAGQTELLESLRNSMRQMDSDIVNEEAKTSDFKRQQIKEAMSFKFGGLEELGEKICIIGELGKLLIEEIPLEETPPGYARAPYQSAARTESTVNEAVKCLGTVQFHAGSSSPKPPGLPRMSHSGSLNVIPTASAVAEREEYESLPPATGSGAATPAQPPQLPPMSELAYDAAARDYPQPVGSDVVWAHDNTHDYEYEQQRHIDAERERENATQSPAPLAEERSLHSNRIPPAPLPEESAAPPSPPAQRGWEPLKLTSSVAGTSLHDGPARTYESPPQEQAQYIPDQAQPPQPQHQYSTDSYANDAYAADAYAADAYATDAYANDPYPADAYAADSYAAETYAGTEYHGQPASIDDPNYEAQTPTQRYSDLPAPRLPGSPASGRNSRRSSGYIPPMAPPAAVYAGVEEYAEDADTGARLSSNTFNAQQDTTRDSYATYDSYPPDSYATFASRRSSDGEEAVVVTIPAEPRTATPTSTSAATAAALYPVPSNGLHATASAGSGSSGPTMSAAAFRGARRARPSFMSEHDDSTHSASPPESRTTTADVLSTPGSHDPPPSYSPEEDLR